MARAHTLPYRRDPAPRRTNLRTRHRPTARMLAYTVVGNLRMTASILGGTPNQDRTVHRRARVTESYCHSVCGGVDKAHEQRGVSFFVASSCRRRSTNTMSTVERRGRQTPLLLWQDAFPFAVVVAEAAHNDSGDPFAGVRHEGGATVITTLRPTPLLAQLCPSNAATARPLPSTQRR